MIRFSRLSLLGLSLALGLAPLAASAREHDRGHDRRIIVQAQPGCPPGLAKKHNGCTPPGLAKRESGEPGKRIRLSDHGLFHLAPRNSYWPRGEYYFRVDGQAGKVLNLIGAVSALEN